MAFKEEPGYTVGGGTRGCASMPLSSMSPQFIAFHELAPGPPAARGFFFPNREKPWHRGLGPDALLRVAQKSHGAIIYSGQLTAIDCGARMGVRLAQVRRLAPQGAGPSGWAFWTSGGGDFRVAPTLCGLSPNRASKRSTQACPGPVPSRCEAMEEGGRAPRRVALDLRAGPPYSSPQS